MNKQIWPLGRSMGAGTSQEDACSRRLQTTAGSVVPGSSAVRRSEAEALAGGGGITPEQSDISAGAAGSHGGSSISVNRLRACALGS